MPEDLDLKPYRDYHDYDLMYRMEAHMDETPGLGAKLKAEMKSYASAFREEHEVARRRVVGGKRVAAATKKKPVAKSAARKSTTKATAGKRR